MEISHIKVILLTIPLCMLYNCCGVQNSSIVVVYTISIVIYNYITQCCNHNWLFLLKSNLYLFCILSLLSLLLLLVLLLVLLLLQVVLLLYIWYVCYVYIHWTAIITLVEVVIVVILVATVYTFTLHSPLFCFISAVYMITVYFYSF